MVNAISRLDPQLAFQYFGDWTDRIAKGELPFAQPPAAAGRRAQYRADIVGLEPRDGLHARPHSDGPAQSDRQRQRQDVWLDRGQYRLHPGARSGAQCGQRDQAPGARPEHADLEDRADGAVALLGRGTDLGQPEHHAQPDDGRKGPGLVHRQGAPAGQPGFLQAGIEPSLGAGLPAAGVRPPAVDV